ncbi:Mitochondrial import receptor subunit TOM7 like [Pseudolycoriella hygida]|uniref:Mitochondrial import receptor subunit TOM7 homolog n=1 Tax=Pseudolycoriella hygida TaxID=35572 RepID=A0A9Q0N2T9_9DIPT|nr:Mitochondrial import receptor subunit TOM7 like [Pseudolycoriella hygida]
MGLSPDAKERLGFVFEVTKTIFHWGFIPAVLYLGFKKGADPGNPELTLFSLFLA